ncbi:MAG: hypothetical protein WCR95_03805 [Eubacteriales bacterium]
MKNLKLKHFLSAALGAVMVFSAFSCSGNGAGSDKQIKSDAFGFSFYYNDDWVENKAYHALAIKPSPDVKGVSNAMITATSEFTEAADADAYWEAYQSSLKTTFEGYSLKKEYSGEDIPTLGVVSAVRVEYTASVGGEEYKYAQVFCIKDNIVYNILLTSGAEGFKNYIDCFEKVIETFEFIPIVPDTGESKQSGGRAASLNKDYYFDYSRGWAEVSGDGMIAVKPENGLATISVQAFSLPSAKASYGVYDYWEEYEKELVSAYPGYTLTKEFKDKEPVVGGVVASRKEYTIEMSGETYRYIQVICIKEGYVFSILFTSDDSEYEEYSPEFENTLKTFKFT